MEKRGNRFLDITGKRFGKLTVIEFIERKNNSTHWKCLCDCGNETVAITSNLRSGHTVSCGCFKFESRNLVHGMKHSRLYYIWTDMKTRCYNDKCKDYNKYGGRGIIVCDKWRNSFESFRDWAYSTGYDENSKRGECTLDRRDVNGNYEPSNCRWITIEKQQNNRRDNLVIEYNGRKQTLAEWSKELNLNYEMVRQRIQRYGWEIDRAFTDPPRETKKRRK